MFGLENVAINTVLNAARADMERTEELKKDAERRRKEEDEKKKKESIEYNKYRL